LKYCRDYDGKRIPISGGKEIEEEFEKDITNNIWLKYFLKITPNLEDDKTWIDFETEILSVIQNMCPAEWLVARSNFEPARIRKTWTREEFEDSEYAVFIDYLLFADEDEEKTIAIDYEHEPPTIDIAGLYFELRKFTRAFELYCCSEINDGCGVTRRYKLNEALLNLSESSSKETDENYIVSFNYTRTFNRFYDFEKDGDSRRYSYVYPHGEACVDVLYEPSYDGLVTSGLVLGTQSFDHDNQDYNISPLFNVFQKHNQQHRYSTLADFQALLVKLRKSAETEKNVNIYILGHSLDVSNHAKLKHLFSENKEATITVFYHDEERFQQYINNITDILGEADVAVRVRFYHQSNPTFGLLIPYWIFEDGRISTDVIENAEMVLQEIIIDYFLNYPLLEELESHTLATNAFVDSVAINEIEKIEMVGVDTIMAKGIGEIDVGIRVRSNGDFRNSDGVVNNEMHSITFDIYLNITERAKNQERYEIDEEKSRVEISGASFHKSSN
jgi:hypothetical protein